MSARPISSNAPSVGQTETGTVTRLFSGKKYGFIKSTRLGSILLPFSELTNSQIDVGSEVKFVLGRNHKGWVAHKITVLIPSSELSTQSSASGLKIETSMEELNMKTDGDENEAGKRLSMLSKPFLVKGNKSDAMSIEELVNSSDEAILRNYQELFTQITGPSEPAVPAIATSSQTRAPTILNPQFWGDVSIQGNLLRQFSLAQLQLLRNDTNSHEWKEGKKSAMTTAAVTGAAKTARATSSATIATNSPSCDVCTCDGERKASASSHANPTGVAAATTGNQCTCRLAKIKSNYTAAAETFLAPLARHLIPPLAASSVSPPPVIASAPEKSSTSGTLKRGNKKRAKVDDASVSHGPTSSLSTTGPAASLSSAATMTAGNLLSLIQSMHAAIADQLIDNAGRFRDSTNTRCGHESFVPHTQLPAALKSFATYITDKLLPRADLQCYSKAAMVMYQFVRIHPFSDGNGRVSRMLGNWVLMKCGLPFPVQFCPSPEKRREYVAACRYVDPRMMCKYVAGCVASACLLYDASVQNQMASALRHWNLVLSTPGNDTIAGTDVAAASAAAATNSGSNIPATMSAAQQRESELSKAAALVFEDEARLKEAATIYRRRQQAEAECVICFETSTSITLHCCGSSCHVACLSRWRLTQRQEGAKKCPCCRQAYRGADQAELDRVKILSELFSVPEHVARSLENCVTMYERGMLDPRQVFGGFFGRMGGGGGGGGGGAIVMDEEEFEDDEEDFSTTFDDEDEDDYDDDDDDDDDDENEWSTVSHDDNPDDDMPDLVGSGSDDDEEEVGDGSMPDLLGDEDDEDDTNSSMPNMIGSDNGDDEEDGGDETAEDETAEDDDDETADNGGDETAEDETAEDGEDGTAEDDGDETAEDDMLEEDEEEDNDEGSDTNEDTTEY